MAESPRFLEILEEVKAELGDNLTPANEPAAVRYAHALDLAERCWAALPAKSIMGRTDRGGQRVHPAIEAALRVERAAAEFGQAIGLEPTGKRAGAGRPAGAASAPDRSAAPAKLRSVK